MSFLSNIPPDAYQPGTQIELYLDGCTIPLHGIIISSETTNHGNREGVRFEKDEQYACYLTNFNIIVSRSMA